MSNEVVYKRKIFKFLKSVQKTLDHKSLRVENWKNFCCRIWYEDLCQVF